MNDARHGSFDELPPSTVSCVIFFGSIIFTTVAMATKAWILGDTRALREAIQATLTIDQAKPSVVPLQQSFQSIYVMLHHFSLLGILIFIVYICERHPPFSSTERQNFDEDSFAFLIIVACIAAFLSIRKNDKWMLKKYGPGRFSDNGLMEDDEKSMFSSDPSTASNRSGEKIDMQQQKSNRLGSSGSSIKSDELVSLLENDSPLGPGEQNDDGVDLPGDSFEEADAILEDITVGDNIAKALEAKELLEHHVIGVPIISPNPDDDVLNIHQSLELRGLMTCCFLFYQSTNAGAAHELYQNERINGGDEGKILNEFYNLSKICSTAFLFLSGFGHAMYFHRLGDYTMRRLITILFRMNMGATFLCLALDKPYIFYKPCAVHTYFFLLIYSTMRWRRNKNYTKFGLRFKMILLAISIYLSWDCDFGVWTVHSLLFGRSLQSISGAPYGQLWEFYFQGHMHHWAALTGMIFAANQPITSLTLRRLEKLGNPTELLFKGIIAIAITMALILWISGPFRTSKYIFNATNAYFGVLPMLWYVFMRNLTKQMRSYHSDILKRVGKHSLEIYLLQHHVFLTDESERKLVLVPGYPACNLIVVISLLLLSSMILKTATSVLICMLTRKSNDSVAVWRSVTVVGSLMVLHAISVTLSYMEISNPESVATATIVCGILFYQAAMDMTSSYFRSMASSKRGTKSQPQGWSGMEHPVVRGSPPVIGAFTILCFCALWHAASMNSSYNSSMPLPSICGNVINEGKWVNIDSCKDFQKGINAREYHSRSYGECTENQQWGWTKSNHPECRFKFHKPAEVQRKLPNENVIFIGDTVTRSLYFAFCRSLGVENLGYFDSEMPVHSELKTEFGNTIIRFQWAPLTSDVLHKMKSVTEDTDLVIAGSGALDKLHLWATDEDRNSYELTIKQLAKDLKLLKENSAPVVWFTPTTINTPALQSQEKRTQMSEKNIQEIRDMYYEFEINDAATFVLDGPTFTKDQVEKSYDGIHYPQHVYDVGAQILINALDWLVQVPPSSSTSFINPSFQPRPGSMANPILGLMVLCCILIGLLFFDGYLGFSYLASVFMQPMSVPAPNRIALFYTSKEEQSRYSFLPQDVYSDVCAAYGRPRRRKGRQLSQGVQEQFPPSKNGKMNGDEESSQDNSEGATGGNILSSGMSMTSRRSMNTFGLATINEDSQ